MEFGGLYPQLPARLSILREHNKAFKIPTQEDKEILISHNLPFF